MWRSQTRTLLTIFNRNTFFCHPTSTSSKSNIHKATMSTAPGEQQQASPASVEGNNTDYSTWNTPSLVARITDLERQLHSRTSEHVPTTTTTTTHLPPSATAARALDPETTSTTTSPPNKKLKKQASSSEHNITRDPALGRPPKMNREMDPSKYHMRFIALKFAYLGHLYNGFEHANKNITPLPTIEEELWKALRKTQLIFPANVPDSEGRGPMANRISTVEWEGCQYSKAGRTDRGVSAFGQVIGVSVRSARPKHPPPETGESQDDDHARTTDIQDAAVEDNWNDVADELPYINMLNRVLPEDIRILAWCPHPPADFNARFSCRERQYKYFFTQPAFPPTPGPLGFAPRAADGSAPKCREGWLDIDAMREAARHFEGVHDFRNFCKLDTTKQIDNFVRRIYHSDIELVDPRNVPLGFANRSGFQALADSGMDVDTELTQTSVFDAAKVYVLSLKGSAFLWHQVRHMVAILFLVGQGFESPSIVPELLDATKNPRKPHYEMASDAPLVLWDCIFPDENDESRKDTLGWVYAGNAEHKRALSIKGDGKFGIGGVVDGLWSVWRQRKIDEILAGSLLELAAGQGDQSAVHRWGLGDGGWEKRHRGQKIFIGSDEPRMGGRYMPIMQRRKMDLIEEQNARWLAARQRRKGPESNS